MPLTAKFFFQLVFAGTAATIVSGAVAERIKYVSFIVFSFLLVAFIYPIVGHWIWGGGWLAELGFWDFAGSTVVHSIGAWAALAGVIVLGPRIGKFGKDGRAHAIPGHNMTSAFAGALILWLGWFGFNPGSTMAADPMSISHIVVTTNMSAAAGALWQRPRIAWVMLGKPDLGMTINGALGGLVGITAGCAFVSIGSSLHHRRHRRSDHRVSACCFSTRSRSTTRSARSPCTAWVASAARWLSASSPRTPSPPARPATASSSAAASRFCGNQLIGVAAVGAAVFACLAGRLVRSSRSRSASA